MGIFNPKPTKTAEWQTLVLEAENRSGYHFDVGVESYLVLTLDHFTSGNQLASSIIAIDYLQALEINGTLGMQKLRSVGDQCLLLSGLFPECVLKKNVSLGYLIRIGQEAYYLVSERCFTTHLDSILFQKLSENFVGLTDVLHAMRHLNPGLLQ